MSNKWIYRLLKELQFQFRKSGYLKKYAKFIAF